MLVSLLIISFYKSYGGNDNNLEKFIIQLPVYEYKVQNLYYNKNYYIYLKCTA